MLDLHVFLGRPLGYCQKELDKWDGLLGRFPQAAIDDEHDALVKDFREVNEIQTQTKSAFNAEKGYRRTKEKASRESLEKEWDIVTGDKLFN